MGVGGRVEMNPWAEEVKDTAFHNVSRLLQGTTKQVTEATCATPSAVPGDNVKPQFCVGPFLHLDTHCIVNFFSTCPGPAHKGVSTVGQTSLKSAHF